MLSSRQAIVPQATPIVIFEPRPGHFYLHLGESHTGDLSWDELLGEVARLTMAGQPDRGRYLRSPQQWEDDADRRRARLADLEQQRSKGGLHGRR